MQVNRVARPAPLTPASLRGLREEFEGDAEVRARRRPSGGVFRLADAAWDALTSVRLAIVLLLLVAAGALVGALLPQAPPPALESPERFAIWVEMQRGGFGLWTDILAALGAFTVFSSTWFRVLMLMLSANVLVGTLTRVDHVWRVVRRLPPARMADSLFDLAPLRGEARVTETLDEATGRIERMLSRRRYRWVAAREAGLVQMAGIKHRYGPLGSLVTHAGVLLVILGIAAAGRGFIESQFIMPVGTTRPIGHGTGLEVEVVSFESEFYPGSKGVPKDYRSEVVLREQGREVARGMVRVNDPLVARGLRVHQSSYGPVIVMQVRDAAGKVLYDGPVALRGNIADRFAGTFPLSSLGLEVFVIGSAATFSNGLAAPDEVRLELFPVGGQELVGLKDVAQGVPQMLNGLEFTYVQASKFTGLSIVRDPALPAVWVGAAMVVLGSIATLYFPRRRVWIRITEADRATTVMLATAKERGVPYEREFGELVREAGAAPRPDVGAPDRSP